MATTQGGSKALQRHQAPKQQHHPHQERGAGRRPKLRETRQQARKKRASTGRHRQRKDAHVRDAQRAAGQPGFLLHRHEGHACQAAGRHV